MVDRELAVVNTSKCEEEKIKGENGNNAAINLRRESPKDQKACLGKNFNLRNSLNFPKVFYSIILKEAIRAVKPTRSSVYVPPQVSISKVLTAKITCNIAQYKLNLYRTSTKQLQLIFSEAPCKI